MCIRDRGNHFSGTVHRVCHSRYDSAAARNGHTHDGDAFDFIICQDVRQFVRVIHLIKLWTANERNLAFDKIMVEITVGKGGARCV